MHFLLLFFHYHFIIMSEISKQDEASLRGYTIYWRIENFNPMPNDSLCLISPACSIPILKSKWMIKINKCGDFLAAYIFKEEQKKYIKLSFSVALLRGDGWIPILEDARGKFGGNSNAWGVDEFINVLEMKEKEWFYLPNGALTLSFRIWNGRIIDQAFQFLITTRLRCECELEQRIDRPLEIFASLKPSDFISFPISYNFLTDERAEKEKTQLQNSISSNELNSENDLLRMFKEHKLSFVTIRTSTKEFSVHKAVLCAKSPVFNAMFERKMREKDCNVVDINDVESETMTSLIKFLHFEPLGDLSWEEAMLLYYAADKYDIVSLKEVCISFLKKGLSEENLCDTFVLAHMHLDKDLMSHAEDYFCENSKKVLHSKKWKDFLLNYTEVAADVLCKLADNI